MTRADAFRLGTAGLFLISVFYGYVWIGITLPLSMLVLPLVFLANLDRDLITNVPRGALLLGSMAIPVALQALAGRPLTGKRDAVVFLSVAYAVATIVALRRTELSERQLRLSLVAGGLITSIVMVATMALLPPGTFLIPGQDSMQTRVLYAKEKREELRKRLEARAAADSDVLGGISGEPDDDQVVEDLGAFERKATPAEDALYDRKALIRSALGRSNTIAWYMVFLFSACFFAGHLWTALLFAGIALATLTRFSLVFMAGILVVWAAWRRGMGLGGLAAVYLGAGLACMTALIVLKHAGAELPISLDARVWHWMSALKVLPFHPVVGTPRSDILRTFDLTITWHPHNGLLWLLVLTGVIGAACYVGFVWVALDEIRVMALTSRLWAGLFVGFVTLLAWSLFEPIALTPTFDVLLAAHYAIARRARRETGFAA